jgi:hypothetical protein
MWVLDYRNSTALELYHTFKEFINCLYNFFFSWNLVTQTCTCTHTHIVLFAVTCRSNPFTTYWHLKTPFNFCLSHLCVQPTHQHQLYTQEADLSHSLPVSHIFSCTFLTAYSRETMMNHLLGSSNFKKKITHVFTCTHLCQVSFKHHLIVKYSQIISHMNSV